MAERSIQAAFPLTPLQEGMLYHTLREPDSEVYHGQVDAILEGNLDEAAFRAAWELAAQRHEAFRTFFAWERREQPLQVVRRTVSLEFDFLDWTADPTDLHEARWRTLVEEDRRRPFELSRAPLMRFTVARAAETRYRLLWGVHHAILDGWSGQLVLQEVLEDHDALAAGRRPERPLPPSYGRFVNWLEHQDSVAAESYWKAQFAGFSDPTPAPAGAMVPPGSTRSTRTLQLSPGETDALSAAAPRLRVTLNTLTVAAWAVLLQRYSTMEDVVFGITASERPPEIPGVGQAAGLYLSTIPVRAEVPSETPVSTWVRDLQITLSEGRAHSAVGLSEIRRWAGVLPGQNLFDTLVVFESFPAYISPPADSVLRLVSASMAGPSDLPIALLAYPGERLTLHLVYDPACLTGEAADRLLRQVAGLLGHLAGDGRRLVGQLPLLAEDDGLRLVEEWGGAALAMPDPEDVVGRFEAAAAGRPDAVALRTADEEILYGALDRRANRIARELSAAGLEPESVVGVPGVRSPESIAAMLGVLKAGCAYLVLDPGLPETRRKAIAAAADVVLAMPGSKAAVATLERPVLDPAESSEDLAPKMDLAPGMDQPPRMDQAPGMVVPGEAAAYVIFTSGSTGEPKGVVVERDQLAYSTAARSEYYRESPERFLLLSPLTVDSSVAGIYWTLSTGGTLVLPGPDAAQDLDGLTRLIQTARCSHTLLVPSLYRALLEEADPERLRSLRTVIVAGEACPASLVDLHRERMPEVELHNEYGPSEATVWATVDELSAHSGGPVTIGRPVPSARVYLLDAGLRPVAPGVPGEIFIGGAAVARGYHERPELTAERFLPDPFAEDGPAGVATDGLSGRVGNGMRMYRTGDRARYLDDGRIEFLGRVDDQMKIRGFRIEPAEIELALVAVSGVREAAVVLESQPVSSEAAELATAMLARRTETEIEEMLRAVESES